MMFRDVDKVHDMMDDIAEQQEVAREISEAISNPVAFGQDIDEVCTINLWLLACTLWPWPCFLGWAGKGIRRAGARRTG